MELEISKDVTVSPKDDLAAVLTSAEPGSKIKLAAGEFKMGRVVLSSSDVAISGSGGVRLSGGPLIVKGRRVVLSNMTFLKMNVEFINASGASLSRCRVDGGVIKITRSPAVAILDTFASSVWVDNSEFATVVHSTLASSDETAPALRINAKAVSVRNSVVYGRGFSVALLRDRTSRKCKFENTLIFGEKGYCVRDRGEVIPAKRDVALTKSRIRRFIKTKSCLYDPPQFVNHLKGDWRLVPGTPGSKAAKDGGDCGGPSSVLEPFKGQ